MILPRWFDLHTHFRQGPNVGAYIEDHLAMGCAGALAMPNTKPPVSRVSGENTKESWTIEAYRRDLLAAGADCFEDFIVPLYLTGSTSASMIEAGAASGLLRACKYYPPHGTTNAEHGVAMEAWIGGEVLRQMEETDTVLCVHGETHGLQGPDYIDAHRNAEQAFYAKMMPRLLDAHPGLRIVCEHITTTTAAEFVISAPGNVAATVTPQHLLFTLGHLIQGLRYHLYCLPVVKFETDRDALRRAVASEGQTKFFAGTDSAPHTTKATECGCAAGCYTGGTAPQLYAMAFEQGGIDLDSGPGRDAFERFLCRNGPAFYRLPCSEETFSLVREAGIPNRTRRPKGPAVSLPDGMGIDLEWSIEAR